MDIWLDSADLDAICKYEPAIGGITTNPTIFKNAGVTNQRERIRQIRSITDKELSIDGPPEIVWSFRCIPKVTARPEFCLGPINHTAVFQPSDLFDRYQPDDIISVFAGRIMDTGRDPYETILAAKKTGARVLWASVREVYNIQQAAMCGCDIVTVPPAILEKRAEFFGMPLDQLAKLTRDQFEADRVAW